MKVANLIIGLVVFSIVTTMMFAYVQNYLQKNNVGDPTEWEELSGNYNQFVTESTTQANSTLRRISNQTKLGEATSTEKDIRLVSGALGGGRLLINFFLNIDTVANKVQSDTDTYVDPRIIPAIMAVIAIIILLSIIFFLRGFKAET